MSKLTSKIATFLFAPVILGASCLTCFLQAMPVSAATISMEQNQDCADYQNPIQTSESAPAISINEPVLALVAYSGMSPSANHISGCKVVMDMDNVAFEIKKQQPKQNFNKLAVLHTYFDHGNYQKQRLHFDLFKTSPKKNNFLTGSVIKRE